MASRQIEIRVPAPVQSPRGADQAGTLAAWLLQGIAQVFHALASRQTADAPPGSPRFPRAW